MVTAVRDRILESEEVLATDLRDPHDVGFLVEMLSTDEPEGEVTRLAAVLWALGLEGEAQRQLFRLLPVLLPPPDTTPPAEVGNRPEAVEKERHKRRRKSAEARVEELERDLKAQRAKNREISKEITRIRTALSAADEESSEQRGYAQGARNELAETRDHAGRLETELRKERKEADRARRQVQRMREELERSEERAEAAEHERGRLGAELASIRTERDSLKAGLRAVPSGKDAVDAFLREEEERIDQDLLILQGGDRRRAEQDHAGRQKLEAAFRQAYPEYVPPRPTSASPVRAIRFRALGGGAEVGRSCYLLEIGTSRVLIDCGIAVGRTEAGKMVPALDGIGSLDAVILTHAHTDHIGWLPALIRGQDASLSIYCTEDTAEITPIMLNDSRGHYERMLAQAQLVARHDPDAAVPVEAYTREDVRDVESRFRSLRWDEPMDLPSTGLRLTFSPAGHILGAASALLEGGGRRVLLSGDISSEPQLTVAAAKPPDGLEDVDLLVLESTYGDRPRTDDGSRDELVRFVGETTSEGTALLPCFALGRGQEVLQILLKAKAAGELDTGLTIWVDGLIRKILPIYAARGRVPENGYEVISSAAERSFAIDRCRRADARAVVVTTSGMLNGGPVVEWAKALLPEPRNRVALLGYQDEGSAGGRLRRELRQGGRPPYTLTLRQEEGGDVPLRLARPPREIGLSAHADQTGLISFAKQIGADRIALVHGDPRAQEALATLLEQEIPGTSVTCPGPEPLEIW